MGRSFAWSLSALKQYETCPYQYKLSRVEKRPEPPSDALERGNRIHRMMEDAVLGKEDLPKGLARFDGLIKELVTRPNLEVEKMWCFTKELETTYPTNWDGTWLRVKMDLFSRDDKKGYALDWKTGGIYPDHREGMKIYAWAAMLRFPELEEVEVDLVYIDQRRAIAETITKDAIMSFQAPLLERVAAMERAYVKGDFPVLPGRHCAWCPWGKKRGDGFCKKAIA